MSNAKLSLVQKEKDQKFKQEFFISPTGKRYYQNEGSWKDKRMNYKNPESDFFKKSGCFITCISNIFESEEIELPGKLQPNPLNLLDFINKYGYINWDSYMVGLDSFSQKFEIKYYELKNTQKNPFFKDPKNVYDHIEQNKEEYNLVIQYEKPGMNSHFVKFESIVEEGDKKFIEIWDPLYRRHKVDFNDVTIRSIRGFQKKKLKKKDEKNQEEKNSSSDNTFGIIGLVGIFMGLATILVTSFLCTNIDEKDSDNDKQSNISSEEEISNYHNQQNLTNNDLISLNKQQIISESIFKESESNQIEYDHQSQNSDYPYQNKNENQSFNMYTQLLEKKYQNREEFSHSNYESNYN
jgi:hypothetical protein